MLFIRLIKRRLSSDSLPLDTIKMNGDLFKEEKLQGNLGWRVEAAKSCLETATFRFYEKLLRFSRAISLKTFPGYYGTRVVNVLKGSFNSLLRSTFSFENC